MRERIRASVKSTEHFGKTDFARESTVKFRANSINRDSRTLLKNGVQKRRPGQVARLSRRRRTQSQQARRRNIATRVDNRKDVGVNAVVHSRYGPPAARATNRETSRASMKSPRRSNELSAFMLSLDSSNWRAHLIEIRIGRVFKIMIRANDALKRIALSHEVHRRW